MLHPTTKRSGLNLWDKAVKLIPGGNMLLSKNKNLFSPGAWPCYYSKAKGAQVWDLDDQPYFDFTANGVGACSLGHAYDPIDEEVIKVIRNGVMSTLNTPKEVELAEQLVSINPWADMVRFARTGGEANAIAIRIARAYTKRDKIAICGYHGWHDWYLAANLSSDSNLDTHLLEGLSPVGVPKGLTDTIIPLNFNDISELDRLEKIDDLCAIKLEVARSKKSSHDYLQAVREFCDRRSVLLIFDECTSGFREEYGGIFNQYPVTPDLAMFGKALGNGYAITAVVGKGEVMASAVDTFISSTFWTESIGPCAASKTLKEMERLRSWEKLPKIGKAVKDIWTKASSDHDIPLSIQGIDALPTFSFTTSDPLGYKTLFTEKMLEMGFLASSAFYPTIAHEPSIVAAYSEALNTAFSFMSDIHLSKHQVTDYLTGVRCSPTFKRLT